MAVITNSPEYNLARRRNALVNQSELFNSFHFEELRPGFNLSETRIVWVLSHLLINRYLARKKQVCEKSTWELAYVCFLKVSQIFTMMWKVLLLGRGVWTVSFNPFTAKGEFD